MAKSSGLGDQFYISGVDLGADINSIGGLSTPRETLPSTGITQSANARLYGKRDGSAEFVAYYNPSAGQAHPTLSALPRTDVHLMYLRGQGLGSQGIGMIAKQLDYNPNRGDDGSLTFAVNAQANAFGLDWGKQLTTGKQTDASATNSTAIDTTASADFGFQAYLQVFSLGSGTAEIDLQDSANNTDFTNLTGGAFTDVTAATVQRLQSTSATGTVRRYVRVATGGTFTNLVFAVIFTKNKALRVI